MASAAVHAFHAQGMREAKRDVALRIANGTKSSSPAVIGARRQHRSFNGIPYDSEGSRSVPFFVNTNQRDCPFASMTGGVIKNYKFAKELLGQRAQSSAVIDSLVNEVPPPEGPLLQLSDVESKSLELNNLLNNIDQEVESGNVTSVISSELNNVLRLYVALLPTFGGDDLAEFQRYFQDVENNAEYKADENPQNKSFAVVRDFMGNLFAMTAEYAPFAERSSRDKIAKIKAVLRRYFKLNKTTIGRLAAEAEVAAVDAEGPAGGDDDDGLPPPPRPGRTEMVVAGPQPAAVEEEALGEEAEEGGPPPPPAAPAGRPFTIRLKARTREEGRQAEAEMKEALRALSLAKVKEVYSSVMEVPQPLPAGVTAGNVRNRIVAKLARDYGKPAVTSGNWAEYYRVAQKIKAIANEAKGE